MSVTTKKKPTKGGKPAPMAPQGPRYQQITDDLVVKLKDGTYPIGSMLPTEVELSAAYDVSRYTVREALRQLEGMGLVNRRQGAGTRVAASVPQQRFVQEIGNLNELLQYPENTRLFMLGAKTVEASASLAQRLDGVKEQRWLRIDGIRRVKVTSAAICSTTIFVRPEYAAVVEDIGTVAGPVYALVERRYNVRVARVDIDISASTVPAGLSDLLGVEPNAPALLIVRRYHDQRGRVFEVSESRHPAPNFRYRFSLRRAAQAGELGQGS
ncbi:MAG: GntR family transcriptional regulator [Hyphomicrobiaceae bacterium]|nr:GntR family transcriptional regulator [Hyphomicrobiaceae bacterium]